MSGTSAPELHPDWPPELGEVVDLAAQAGDALQCRVVCRVPCGAHELPVHALTLGNPDPAVPAMGIFGGVHGLERIGADVALSFLRSLVARLPWYRGIAGAPMQLEAQALCDVVEQDLLPHAFALSIDCHSGFDLADRLWFPHAHTPLPVAQLPDLHALGELLDVSLLHHRYLFEPQSLQYLSHGDLWDHLYLRAEHLGQGTLLPLTLEMGSWLWVKKNPRQVFSRHGIFNPLMLRAWRASAGIGAISCRA